MHATLSLVVLIAVAPPHHCTPQLDASDLRQGAAEGLDAILSGAQSSLVMPYASSKVRGRGLQGGGRRHRGESSSRG